MANTDQDLEFKLRFRRVLFFQGYWSPIEVELSEFERLDKATKRTSLTDLDVLGIKYDYLFTPFRVVGDCKSGRKVSQVNRLFWLRGVKEFFGADQAYFIHPLIQAQTRRISPKLALRVLDNEGLDELEKNLTLSNYPLPLADVSIYQKIDALWGINVPKGQKPSKEQLDLKRVYSYLRYSYWYFDQHRNLLNIVNNFREIAPVLEVMNPAHKLLAYTGLERFAHSLLETASFIMTQGGTNIPRDSRVYIFGGNLALREKEDFFELLRNLTNSKEQLDPLYLHDVIELLGRMMRNPTGAHDVLRHISAIYLWCVHLGNISLIPIDGKGENTPAIVLARDLAHTFAKITGIREALFEEVLVL